MEASVTARMLRPPEGMPDWREPWRYSPSKSDRDRMGATRRLLAVQCARRINIGGDEEPPVEWTILTPLP